MRALGIIVALIVLTNVPAVNAEPSTTSTRTSDPKEDKSDKWLEPRFTFQWENDMFTGTDRHYTNGMRATALFSPTQTPSFIASALKNFSHVKGERFWFTGGIGQDMYTPADASRTDLILDDRPYGGWLYAAASIHKLSPCLFGGSKELDCLDSVEANLGIVGPSAYAKESQDFVHSTRNIDRFEGWDNQLENEIGFVMTWERKRRWIAAPEQGWGYDVIPNISVSLGNVRSQINAGTSLRIGYNIPKDFGAPTAIKPVASLPILEQNRLGAYFFIAADSRYVAHNIFIDGNTFVDSHNVARKPWVYDIAHGVAISHGPYRLSIARVFRSKEFDGQDGNTRFSSLTLTMKF